MITQLQQKVIFNRKIFRSNKINVSLRMFVKNVVNKCKLHLSIYINIKCFFFKYKKVSFRKATDVKIKFISVMNYVSIPESN